MGSRFAAAAFALLAEVRSDALSLLQTNVAKVHVSRAHSMQDGVAHVDAGRVAPEMSMQPEDHAQRELSLVETGATVDAHVASTGASERTLGEADSSSSHLNSTGGLEAYGGNVVDLVVRGWKHGGAKAVARDESEAQASLAQKQEDLFVDAPASHAEKQDDVLTDALGETLDGLHLNALPVAEGPEALQRRAHQPSLSTEQLVEQMHVSNNVTESILTAAQAALVPFDAALESSSL